MGKFKSTLDVPTSTLAECLRSAMLSVSKVKGSPKSIKIEVLEDISIEDLARDVFSNSEEQIKFFKQDLKENTDLLFNSYIELVSYLQTNSFSSEINALFGDEKSHSNLIKKLQPVIDRKNRIQNAGPLHFYESIQAETELFKNSAISKRALNERVAHQEQRFAAALRIFMLSSSLFYKHNEQKILLPKRNVVEIIVKTITNITHTPGYETYLPFWLAVMDKSIPEKEYILKHVSRVLIEDDNNDFLNYTSLFLGLNFADYLLHFAIIQDAKTILDEVQIEYEKHFNFDTDVTYPFKYDLILNLFSSLKIDFSSRVYEYPICHEICRFLKSLQREPKNLDKGYLDLGLATEIVRLASKKRWIEYAGLLKIHDDILPIDEDRINKSWFHKELKYHLMTTTPNIEIDIPDIIDNLIQDLPLEKRGEFQEYATEHYNELMSLVGYDLHDEHCTQCHTDTQCHHRKKGFIDNFKLF